MGIRANGLGACSLKDVGYQGNDFPSPTRIRFSTAAAGCPVASKIGSAKVTTPLLAKPLPGVVYLAAQDANPFGSRFAIYLVVDDVETGTEATIAGRVTTDKATGQVTATFSDNPQVPIEDVEVDFFDGPRASLANPDVCGTYDVSTALTPWSAVDPDNPLESETARSVDPIAIDSGPGGAGCPASKAQRPFDLGFSAGTRNAVGGDFSPFSLHLTRPNGSQELDRVLLRTPKGLAASLKGVTVCSWQAVAAAANRAKGTDEIADPSCPASSLVGSTTIGAGVGPEPVYVRTGRVYRTGPYQGAPLSLTFVVPAVTGPFDLGVQVVKTALFVDPKTAQVTASSDAIPKILDGVPLQVRDVRVDLDRRNFTINPSSCETATIAGEVSGASGASADLADRFQVADCAALPFKPKLAMRLTGRKQVRTGKHPGVRAQVNQTGIGEAGIEKAEVRLPKSLALDPDNAQALCEFADGTKDDLENHCPKGSIVGRSRATSPLLNDPLVGNVYFVKNIRIDKKTGNQIRTLPMIIVALRGEIAINLKGESDTTKSGKLVNTFNGVPDAPVSKFNLNIKGGSKGILAVTRTRRSLINLCAKPHGHVAEADMDGHNGKRHDRDIRMKTPCSKRQTKAAKRKAKRAAAKRAAARRAAGRN